jgi:phage-related protein
MMSFDLLFYETSRGNAPALDFLRRQPKAVRAEAGWLLEQLEKYGNALERPIVGYLEDGIYELRWEVDRTEFRLLFFFSGRQIIVVTHGFTKKTRRVLPDEIDRARRLRADWMARN